jgi:hypothetical protein
MEYLAEWAKKVLEWAAKEEKSILQLTDLQRYLRKSNELDEESIDLLLIHLQHSG